MPTRTKLNTEDRQAELVQAAVALSAQRSPAEVTTGDLAQAVGLTQGAVFRHFESKEAIWLAVLDWAHQALISRLRHQAQAPQADALQALRAVFMAHIEFVKSYPGIPRLVFQELQDARPTPLKDKVQRLMADYRALVADVLSRGHGQGVISPNVDRKAATVLFMGAVQGLVMQSLASGTLRGITPQARNVFDIYAAGLTAMPPPQTGKRP